MGRRNERAMKGIGREVAKSSRGDSAAALASLDAQIEEGTLPEPSQPLPTGGDLMVQRFRVGRQYWVEAAPWVYVGEVVAVGLDYIEIGRAMRMPSDGRHGLMMRTGTAPGIEWEPTGGRDGFHIIATDVICTFCEWHHVIPSEAV